MLKRITKTKFDSLCICDKPKWCMYTNDIKHSMKNIKHYHHDNVLDRIHAFNSSDGLIAIKAEDNEQ